MTTELNYSSILGTKINVTDMEKTVSYIAQHLKELKGHYICVSNVHTTVTAYRDEEYRDVQNNAAMNIPMVNRYPLFSAVPVSGRPVGCPGRI